MKQHVRIFVVVVAVMMVGAALGGAPAMAVNESYVYDSAGRLIQTTKDDGQTVDYFYDQAGNLLQEIRSGTRNAVSYCSDLSHPKKDSFPDRDVYVFNGKAGELVTVRVMADPPEKGMGLKSALTLRDRTVQQAQKVTDSSVLPNKVSMILEKDGAYEVEIHGQKQVFKELRYSGPYCVTLEAMHETAASLIGPE